MRRNLTVTIAACVAASLLVTASAGFGVVYAWTTGAAYGPVLGTLSVSLALGLELAKPVAIAGAFTALAMLAIGRAIALGTLGLVAVVFSLTAELSLVAQLKADKVGERTQIGDTVRRLLERRTQAVDELATLPAARPVEALDALVRGLKATPKLADCGDPTAPEFGPVSRRVCAEIAAVEAERAMSVQRGRVQAELRALDESIEKASRGCSGACVADPGAAALATYLRVLGLNVQAGTLTEWMVLVPVIALEIGSALVMVLVRGTGLKSEGVGTTRINRPLIAPALVTVSGAPSAKDAVMAYLQERGGHATFTVRGLAAELRLSPTRVQQVLKGLATEKQLSVTTSRSGTAVRIR
jgi:hypothetical protein